MKNPHAVALGKKGGAAGRGAAKTRSRAHYVKIAKASVKARRAKRLEFWQNQARDAVRKSTNSRGS